MQSITRRHWNILPSLLLRPDSSRIEIRRQASQTSTCRITEPAPYQIIQIKNDERYSYMPPSASDEPVNIVQYKPKPERLHQL